MCRVTLPQGIGLPGSGSKKVFKNKDGSSGTLCLAISGLELSYEEINALYERRWKVEEYHKSQKRNCSLDECQASSHSAQGPHFYRAALAFIQLEKVKTTEGNNHIKLMRKIEVHTTKCNMAAVKKHLHITLTSLKWLPEFSYLFIVFPINASKKPTSCKQ